MRIENGNASKLKRKAEMAVTNKALGAMVYRYRVCWRYGMRNSLNQNKILSTP